MKVYAHMTSDERKLNKKIRFVLLLKTRHYTAGAENYINENKSTPFSKGAIALFLYIFLVHKELIELNF